MVSGGGLGALEELAVSNCGVTVTGLQLLMLHCQHLALVGPLISWPAITQADLQLLREQIVCSNWCLDLKLRIDAPLRPVF